MEVVTNSYMPGDPRLVEQLVYELKSQGIFDQFRKECIADVDTKPAYQNLRQRVEGSVTSFLKQQTWRPDMNKNQVREQLRKNIYESGYLDTGVERIVDQVVNPKINTIFLPQVEDVVYRYLGIEKPNRLEVKKELKIDVTDLLPTDLEAISPESDHTKDDSFNFNDSLNSESKMEEDESPPFEPIDGQSSNIHHEENSVDSHLSGFSGLQSHDSNTYMEPKVCQMELSNQDSQASQNSSESRLSIITSEDNTKMEIREDSDSKLLKSSDSNSQMEIYQLKTQISSDSNFTEKAEVVKAEETDSSSDNNIFDEKSIKRQDDEKDTDKANDIKKKVIDEKQGDDKKYNDRKSEDKKSRSSDKYGYKDKKDDKYRKSSSSSNRDKDKSSSKYSSSSSSKDKTKTKDKKDSRSNSNSKDKDKNEKDNYKNEKDKDKVKNEKDKEKSEKDKDKERKDKDKNEKERVDKTKLIKEKEKSVKDKDKNKSSSSSSSSSSSKHNNNKEKDKSSSSLKPDSSKKDKEKPRSSSSSNSKDNKSKSSYSDSKSKSSSSDKHKKDDKSTHIKHSNSSSNSKKDKDKKKTTKKDDDHYSSKEKKNDRRSTDRDSNDGRSSKSGQINSFAEGQSSQTQKSSQESSNSNSGSGSGDSGTSDQNEHVIKSPIKVAENEDNKELPISYLDTQKFKYIKPKFASNFQEARKLMKIRKQLAKLERHNQLSLAQIEVPTEVPIINGINCAEKDSDIEERNDENINETEDFLEESKTAEVNEGEVSAKEDSLLLQSRELSKENWEALEARLAQEMSNINYNSYESYDDYEYGGYNSTATSPRKIFSNVIEKCAVEENVEKIVDTESNQLQQEDVEETVEKPALPQTDTETVSESNVMEEIEMDHPCTTPDDTVSVTLEDNSCDKTTENEICSEEEVGDVQKDITENKPTDTDKLEDNMAESTEIVEHDEVVTEMVVDTVDAATDNADNVLHSDSDSNEPCIYLEPLSPRLDKNLQFLYKYIEKLEQDVKHSLKTFQNNFVPLKERYGKRKLVENVDVKNNNKTHYEQTTDIRKRRRSAAPNANSVISKANKEKLCNSSDISPNDSFSLPLSPAESDKSNDKKEEESPKPKQKREPVGRNINARSQRYSSEDLYKPRPIFISSRRSRSAKNLGK